MGVGFGLENESFCLGEESSQSVLGGGAVQAFVLDLEKVDKWAWKDVRSLEFSVKSDYVVLKGGVSKEKHLQLFKALWRIKALPSAHFVAWKVLENNIATKVNLVKREILVKNIMCSLCGEKDETSSHLFFGCRFAWIVWSLCYAWLGLKSIDPLNPHSHFLYFNMCNAHNFVNLVLGNVWIAVISEILCVRNKVIFKDEVIDHLETFSLAQLKV